jgi:hypothetical protein
MSANNSSLAPQRCPRCARRMQLVRRTQRFGGLPDLCTFECPREACRIQRNVGRLHGMPPMYTERRKFEKFLGELGELDDEDDVIDVEPK